MKNLIKSWNKTADNIDSWINETFGKKLPEWLDNNMGKIYFIFFILTILATKEAYNQRGYFAVGGEIIIMIIPVIIRFYLEIRKDNIRYYRLLEELEEVKEWKR